VSLNSLEQGESCSTSAAQVVSFYFTSFDETWKGGFDGDNPMDKAEKHWGLFNSDRTPKQVMQ